MRIAFLHRQLQGGGTEADLRRMAEGLAARGHDVHVFCARAGVALAGVQVHRVPVPPGGRLIRLLAFAVAAPAAAGRGKWDVVVGCGRSARQDVVRVGGGTHRTYLARMEAAGLRGRGRGPYHRAILWLERRQFTPGALRRVIAVSGRVRDEIVADYAVPAERIAVLYNGVDGERFHPRLREAAGPSVRRELAVPDGWRVCATIGTGFQRKGVDILLRMWGERPPPATLLLVVGDDERLAQVRRQVARTGLDERVRVVGARTDVDRILGASDVLCLASRQEAFGNVVLEACAAGVPVVTSRRAGAAELLDGSLAGLVVDDPEDEVALRGALDRALGPDGAALALAARRRAEELPWARHVEQLEAILGEVAGDGRR